MSSGDPELMRSAVTRLDALDVPATEARARRLLRSAGVTVPSGRRPSTRANAAGLTRREQEILDLLAEGTTNAQIAHRLTLSERTVDHHVSTVLRKLDVPSRQAAVRRARDLGLIPTASRT